MYLYLIFHVKYSLEFLKLLYSETIFIPILPTYENPNDNVHQTLRNKNNIKY